MHRSSLAHAGLFALATGFLAAPSHSQTIVLEEDFEQGLSDWTTNGMWHWISDADPCGQTVAPYPSNGGSVRFGAADCTYSDGDNAVSGSLTSPPITLPSNAGNLSLTYYQIVETEHCNNGWDVHRVSLSTDGGGAWQELTNGCQSGELLGMHGDWRQYKLDLSVWGGYEVLLEFHFDSVDGAENETLGWLVDDIQVLAGGCEAETYCFAFGNSFSSGASIGYLGSKRIQDNDFTLTVDSAPPGQFGLFFYGGGADFAIAGNGAVCVSSGLHSLVRLPAGQVDLTGRMEQPLDLPGSLNGPNAIVAGSVWNFQFWFRDQDPIGTATFNFSDGLRVAFCP